MDYLTAEEVAGKLRVTTRTVQRMCVAGELPSVKLGKLIRVPVLAWEQWQAEQTASALASLKTERGSHAEAV